MTNANVFRLSKSQNILVVAMSIETARLKACNDYQQGRVFTRNEVYESYGKHSLEAKAYIKKINELRARK